MRKRTSGIAALALLAIALGAVPVRPASAGILVNFVDGIVINPNTGDFQFPVELGLSVEAVAPVPFGPNFGLVNSLIRIETVSPAPGTKEIVLFDFLSPPSSGQTTIAGGEQAGVSTIFDVLFRLSFEDMDASNNFFNGASDIVLTDQRQLAGTKSGALDPTKPNLGTDLQPGDVLFTPSSPPVEVGDVNGDGNIDFLDYGMLMFLDSDNELVNQASVDVSGSLNPPFGPFQLSGPTTLRQPIVFAPQQVPEPASLALLVLGLAALGAARRRVGRHARETPWCEEVLGRASGAKPLSYTPTPR